MDDSIIVSNNLRLTYRLKENLKKEFEIISEDDLITNLVSKSFGTMWRGLYSFVLRDILLILWLNTTFTMNNYEPISTHLEIEVILSKHDSF